MPDGQQPMPSSDYAQRYVDSLFEENTEPAQIKMPSEVPVKNDGSFFKWWEVEDDQLLAPDEYAQLMNDAVAVAKFHFNATYSFNDSMNIADAGKISSKDERDDESVIAKTYSVVKTNDGYVFQRWEIETFDGNNVTKTTSEARMISVSIKKLQSSEKRVNAYVNVTAIFAVDSSWTIIYYTDDTMNAFRVNGIAKDDILHSRGNVKVKRVVFGKAVTGIENGCFMGCTSLEEVQMHSGMWQFGMSVFDGCISLSRVAFK